MNPEQPMPFPDDLEEDWAVSELTDAPVEPSPEIPDHLRSIAEPHAVLVSPLDFPAHPRDFQEPAVNDLQKLLYDVVAERPINTRGVTLYPGEIETYDIMSTLSYGIEDLTEILMAHWGRRIGYMLAGVSFRKSEKIHWYFDRDDPSADAYHVAIETALSAYEQMPGNSEKLQEIIW